MGNSGIYLIKNKINGNVYVGSAVDLDRRWRIHLHDLRIQTYPHCHLQKAFNKYGESSFEFEVLERCAKEDLTKGKKREQYWINKYKRLVGWDNMYNECPIASSMLGFHFSSESRAKMSKVKKGNKYRLGKKHSPGSRAKISEARMGMKLSPETKAKISEAQMGEKNPFWGRKHTPEVLEKISRGHKGKKLSLEHRAKLTKAKMGKTLSLETKVKISEAHKGKKLSLETKVKISKGHLGRKKGIINGA